LVFLPLGIYGLAHGLHEQSLSTSPRGWVVTPGEVLDISQHCGSSCTYVATVQFFDQRGAIHLFEMRSSSEPEAPANVQVAYNPKNLNQARDLSAAGGSWWAEIIAMIVIIVVASAVIVSTARMYMRQRSRDKARGRGDRTATARAEPDFRPTAGNDSSVRWGHTDVVPGPALDSEAEQQLARLWRLGAALASVAIAFAVLFVVLLRHGVSYTAYDAKIRGLTYLASFGVVFLWAGLICILRARRQRRILATSSWRRVPCYYAQSGVGTNLRRALLLPLEGGGERALLPAAQLRWNIAKSGVREARQVDFAGDPDKYVVVRVPGSSVLTSWHKPRFTSAEARLLSAFR
jgi:hypothetical protein